MLRDLVPELQVLLLGGSPCAGKSTLAKNLSEQFEVPWISTDTIRSFMTSTTRPEDFPGLFYRANVTAEEYLTTRSPKQIVEDQVLEGQAIWRGVETFMQVVNGWDSYIIEGVGILPAQVKSLRQPNTKAIFLIDNDQDRVRNIIHTRGLYGPAASYSDSVKPSELEWVMEYNRWIERETEKYGQPLIEIVHREKIIDDIVTKLS